MPSRFPFALADLFETNHPVSQVPVESKVIETRAVELVKEMPKEVVREVTVPILTREEVAKEVHLTKTVVQDLKGNHRRDTGRHLVVRKAKGKDPMAAKAKDGRTV